MASSNTTAFSPDGQFLAICDSNSKLKIWETATNYLKQEFVPDSHLLSPCGVIAWILSSVQCSDSTNPSWKKRRKKSNSEDVTYKHFIAMGTANGSITLYDVAASAISDKLENGHRSNVSAIAWTENAGLFTAGDDKHIVQWNLEDKSIKCKWKVGKGKITSLCVLPEGKTILSGDRIIKWWDIETKQLIGTFTGHANQVNSLCCAKVNNDVSYLFGSANGDNYLSVWSLSEAKKDTVAIATLTLPDEALSTSVHITKKSEILVLSVSRSGQAHLFKYQKNGPFSKPLKPIVNILIASENSSQNKSAHQIPIVTSKLTSNSKILMAYGVSPAITVEEVKIDYSNEVQCLIRTDLWKSKEKKEEAVTKVKLPDSETNVAYISPGIGAQSVKRMKPGAGVELPLKDRLENLSIDIEANSQGKTTPKGDNMVQLLLQGLHSKDKSILSQVLYVKNENKIKNTVAKLPVQAIIPLLKELTTMLQGKTYPCKIAVIWLKALLIAHAAQMISHPGIHEALAPILSTINAKVSLFTEIAKLKGKVSLIAGQIAQCEEKQETDITEECLLTYQDEDSSEENSDVDEMELNSESEDTWEEMSDNNEMQEDIENEKSDEYASGCSSE